MRNLSDLIRIVKELTFPKVKNDFQKILCEEMIKMQKSKMTPTPTDKTSNMFILSKNNYQNVLRNAITTTYKQMKILDQKSTKKVSSSQNRQIH